MHNFVNKIWLSLILLLAANFPPFALAAKDQGIDAVLILDNSGSMKQSDVRALRVEAARMFINLLSDKDRAAVIRFSGKSQILAEMLPLSNQRFRSKLLNSVDRITSDGAHTNIHNALNKGYRLLKQTKRPGRSQHIILMSDGEMDVGKKATDLTLTDSLLAKLAPKIAKSHIKVHTIAFTDSSNLPLLQLASNDTKGSFNLLKGQSGIHEVFESIFERSAKPNMLPLKEDSFVVDDAIKEMTVVISKYKPNAIVGLETPDGETFFAKDHPNRVRWYKAKQFDLITIKNPSSGYWLIKFSEGGNRTYVITDLQLTVESPTEVALGNEFHLQAWLEQAGKKVTKSSVLSGLRLKAIVTSPNGKQTSYNLSKKSKGVYGRTFTLNNVGSYKIEIASIGETFDRQRSAFVRVVTPENSEPFAYLDDKYADKSQQPLEVNSIAIDNKSVSAQTSIPVESEKTAIAVELNEPMAETQTPEPAMSEQVHEQEAKEEESNAGKMALLVFLIINVVGICGLGGWFWFRKRNRDRDQAIDLAEPMSDELDSTPSVNLSEIDLDGIDEEGAMEEDDETAGLSSESMKKDD